MKLFRTKSNASTPSSNKPKRLSRILGVNRSKVDVAGHQDSPAAETHNSMTIPTNPFPSPGGSTPPQPDLPPYLPPLPDAVGNGTFIALPRTDSSARLNSDNSIIDERAMTRKLLDVESSFVPEERSTAKLENHGAPDSASRWPFTRSVSPDRTAKAGTYLSYGPGKVHHRTVTYNAADDIPTPNSHQDPNSAGASGIGNEDQLKADEMLARTQSQSSTTGDGEVRSYSRAQDQSFYTAVTNLRSDTYQTPTHATQTFQRSSTLDINDDELDYGDSPVEASVEISKDYDIPSSPITAANLRKVERSAPMHEPEANMADTESHDETTPKQTRKRISAVTSQRGRLSSDDYVLHTNGTFYNTQSERSLSPLPPPVSGQNRATTQISPVSVFSAPNISQRPSLHERQMSQQSTASSVLSVDSLGPQRYLQGQHQTDRNSRVSNAVTEVSQASSNQSRQYATARARDEDYRSDKPQRPTGLESRQTSQFSTISSSQTTDMLDELDQGADYAIQTGGAMSADSSFSQTNGDLRRPPSLGSIASSIVYDSPKRAGSRFSGDLNFNRTMSSLEKAASSSSPATPRPAARTVAEPTDTVLAQHVRDIFVPETVAREYRANHSVIDTIEGNTVLATPKIGYGNSSLTLKEQNSKIDKLTKENFDLKLKIHFLYEALQNRSDEGVKDMISKNAHLQTELVKIKKENQSLRRRLRALEKEQQDQADATSATQSVQYESEDEQTAQAIRYEDEIAHFKDRAENLEVENGKLVQVWQDMLNEEQARRRKNEQEIQRLQQENMQLKDKQHPAQPEIQQLQQENLRMKQVSATEVQELQQEIARLKDYRSPLRRLKLRRSRPSIKREETGDSRQSLVSEPSQDRQEGESLSGVTAVEQLKQENADLRRDLGAQTSMLTSRNRERERLQQEIEDLKLLQRHGDGVKSVAGDSILDRSVSRNQMRPASRTSGYSQLSDADRDHYESVQARLRDENALLRMRNQDLQRDVNELDDLRLEGDADIEQLSVAIKQMESQLEEKEQEILGLLSELRAQEEESNAFRRELKDIGDSLNQVMDDRESTQSTIESLQKDLMNANAELDAMEQTLREAQSAKERLEVQQESSQSEISFLREEQEADKIKIGELESSLKKVKGSYRDEQAILKDVDELAADAQRAREDARRLRKTLATKEEEATTSAEKLKKLENTLHAELDNWDGSSADLIRHILFMRQDLENMVAGFEQANASLNEKEDLIAERESLLDASNLEIRRLTELVNSERRAHKAERADLEERSRESKITSTAPEVQLAELEYARMQHRRQLASLDQSYTKQLDERNMLLFSLWTRLLTICGPAWAKQHNITEDQDTVPTLERVVSNLPLVNEKVVLALTHIDATVTHFRAKLNKTEDGIWQDFQKLDQALQSRFKRLDQLEKLAQRNTGSTNNAGTSTDAMILADLARFKDENKLLRRENKQLKQSNAFSLPGLAPPRQNLEVANTTSTNRSTANSSVATSPRSKRHSATLTTSIQQQSTSPSASEQNRLQDDNIVATTGGSSSKEVARPGAGARSSSSLGSTSALGMGRSPYVRAPSFGQQQQQQRSQLPLTNGSSQHMKSQSQTGVRNSATGNMDQTYSADDTRWVIRLEEMQKRLEKEREGRLLDRDGARTRLLEERKEVEGLKKELARVKGRGARATGVSGGRGGADDGVD